MINVTVVKLPGAVHPLVLEEGATVADALDVAVSQVNFSYDQNSLVSVAGTPINDPASYTLSNNQRITVSQNIKGN